MASAVPLGIVVAQCSCGSLCYRRYARQRAVQRSDDSDSDATGSETLRAAPLPAPKPVIYYLRPYQLAGVRRSRPSDSERL